MRERGKSKEKRERRKREQAGVREEQKRRHVFVVVVVVANCPFRPTALTLLTLFSTFHSQGRPVTKACFPLVALAGEKARALLYKGTRKGCEIRSCQEMRRQRKKQRACLLSNWGCRSFLCSSLVLQHHTTRRRDQEQNERHERARYMVDRGVTFF